MNRAISADLSLDNARYFGQSALTMNERARLAESKECFTVADLHALTDLVASTWLAAAHRDWSVPAGIVEWSCLATADHAVDCVYAPAFFLASRELDRYPVAGSDLTLGASATPELLVDSLWLASRMLAAVVNDAEPGVRAIIFQRPDVLTGAPPTSCRAPRWS